MTSIRLAKVADLATLAVMQREFYGEEYDVYHPDLAEAVAAGLVFVVDEGGAPVGYLVIELFGPDQPNLPSSVFLSDLFVVPAARSAGLGTKLIKAALAAPWPAAYPRFTLTHDSAEPGLTAYYARFGFVEAGCTKAGNMMMTRPRELT
jgi:predicted N-acetyltransferase YhbS